MRQQNHEIERRVLELLSQEPMSWSEVVHRLGLDYSAGGVLMDLCQTGKVKRTARPLDEESTYMAVQ